LAVLAGQQRPATVPRIEHLARLCHLSAGVVRTAQRSDGRYFRFRASGSAGGLFPLELYVTTHGVGGLEDGVYWFDPNGHALVRIGPPAVGRATSLVVSGVPGRTGWRYAERGLRHLYWDAGAMLANTLAVAQADGLNPRLYTVFPDRAVASLIGADGVHEFPLAIVALGSGEPAIGAGGRAATGAVDRFEPVEFPLITATQRAGDSQRLQAPGLTVAPLAGESPASRPLEEVILDRISCRRFDPDRSISRDAFEQILSVSLRGCAVPHFVAVHAVDGLAPGLYRWPALDTTVRSGDLRSELFRVCGQQELGRDAAFVVIAATDAERISDRGYRAAQLEAGIIDGRLHLAATALRLAATGLTFLDSEIPTLLREPLAGLLLTGVGTSAYRHRPGGPPGSPTTMRPVRITPLPS
jgi:hypothetical protein